MIRRAIIQTDAFVTALVREFAPDDLRAVAHGRRIGVAVDLDGEQVAIEFSVDLDADRQLSLDRRLFLVKP